MSCPACAKGLDYHSTTDHLQIVDFQEIGKLHADTLTETSLIACVTCDTLWIITVEEFIHKKYSGQSVTQSVQTLWNLRKELPKGEWQRKIASATDCPRDIANALLAIP